MSDENVNTTLDILRSFLMDERQRRITAEGQVEELTLRLRQLTRREGVRGRWGRVECDCGEACCIVRGPAARADVNSGVQEGAGRSHSP